MEIPPIVKNSVLKAYLKKKGDIATAADDGQLETLPVGPDGTVLSADSSQPTGFNWVSVAAANSAIKWGNITGNLGNQNDLENALNGKEPANANIQGHIASTSNPHNVTAAQVLPNQAANSGKFLTTNGTTVSWADPSAGTPPTGNGFRHVTAGAEDPTAKLVANADVDPAAAIAESKLALNYATHSNANDPVVGEKAALAGTTGTPGSTNKYVTNADSRLSDARTPTAHGSLAHTGTIGTPTQVGLGNLTNDAQVKKAPASTDGNLVSWSGTTGDTVADSGKKLSDLALATHNHSGVYEAANANIQGHIGSTANPHNVNAAQVLPNQAPNSGKFLTTNGTTVSWGDPSAGTPPTGSGFRHVTAGAEDPTAKLVANADVDSAAAITESKLALNYPTHSNANDPAAGEKAALAGTSGTPGSSNKYVTNSDSRLSDTRTPTAHGSSAHAGTIGTPAQVGLGNVQNLDQTNPANITQDSTHRFVSDTEKSTWNNKLDPNGSATNLTGFPILNQNTTGTAAGLTAQYIDWNASSGGASIKNKPAIPSALSQLSDDATHRLVSDTEKSTWNGKQNALGFTPVPNTRNVAGHSLAFDVTLSNSDVGLGNVTNDTQIPKNLGTTKGDIIAFSGAGVPVRVPVGIDNKVLVADSTQSSGVAWKDAPGGAPAWGGITGTLSNQTDLQASLIAKEASANKGVANGYAGLDSTGKVPVTQLPAGLPSVASWPTINSKPKVTLGDTGYGPAIQDAITAIGGTEVTLVIPRGTYTAPTSFPANISLEFARGGVIDFTAVPHGNVTAVEAVDINGNASSTRVRVAAAGHGMTAGTWVRVIGIKTWPWNQIRTVQKIKEASTDYFTLEYDAHLLSPLTDTGLTFTKIIFIKGTIDHAPHAKIFNCASPCIVFGDANPTGPTPGDQFLMRSHQYAVKPEWWGAVGDYNLVLGGTDDFLPLHYCINSIDAPGPNGSRAGGVMLLSSLYKSTDTISILNANTYRSITVKGKGKFISGIYSTINGYPVMEVLGCNYATLDNFSIIGGAGSTAGPTVGLLVGRSSYSDTSNHCRYNILFEGRFLYFALFNHNSEMCSYDIATSLSGFGTPWVAHIGHGSLADYSAVVPRNVGKASDNYSCFQNNFDRLRLEGGMPEGSCLFYSHQDHSIGGGIYTVKNAYLATGSTPRSTCDFFRFKGFNNLHLEDAVVEGEAIGGYYLNYSSNGAVYNIIVVKNAAYSASAPKFLKADSNTNFLNSDVMAPGDVDIVNYRNGRIQQTWASSLFKITNAMSGSDVFIADGTTTVQLPTAANLCRGGGVHDQRSTNPGQHGKFTMDAAATKIISSDLIPVEGDFATTGKHCVVVLTPVNASAAVLQGSSNALYESESDRVARTSFKVKTASGGSAAGTEIFNWEIRFF
jgi:hypothetical protein